MKKRKQRTIMFLGVALLLLVALCLALPTFGISLFAPLLAWLAPKAVIATGAAVTKGVVLCATLPFLVRNIRLDSGAGGEGGGGGGGGGGEGDEGEPSLKSISDKVDKGIAAVQRKQEKILADASNWSKELKSVIEDITKLKTSANDTQAAREEFTKKLASIDAIVRRDARIAFGNPLQRISADEELRQRVNIAIRLAMDNKGDLVRVVRNGYQGDLVKKALGEDASPGSTLINQQLMQEMYDLLVSYGVWSRFGVRRMGTKLTKLPLKTARAKAQFILTEGDTIADDGNKAGATVDLEVEVIAALLNVSLQLLQDSEFDVTADVMDDFAQAYSERLDTACCTATGAADGDNGGMTGVFQFNNPANAGAGLLTVEQTELEDWTRVLLTVDPIVLTRPSTMWCMHPQQIVRALAVKDKNGRPIFLTALEAPAAGSIGSILGYPVCPAYVAPSTNAAGSKIATFGDGQAQVVGVREDYSFEASDHHKWNTYQRSFRGVGRAGTKLRASGAMKPLAVFTLPAV
jgi:HK97 family phage major capsid protein